VGTDRPAPGGVETALRNYGLGADEVDLIVATDAEAILGIGDGGAITVAAVLAGLRVARSRPSEQRVVIFGAGTAGMGIADQIRTIMVDDGLETEAATRRFWAIDKQGLLLDDMTDLRDFQKPYARPRSDVAQWGSTDVASVVEQVHPTITVGTSTVGGAFSEPIVREMAKHVENLRTTSASVAVAVAKRAAQDGVAEPLDDPVEAVQEAMWQAAYRHLEVPS
jgi:malic enzyme